MEELAAAAISLIAGSVICKGGWCWAERGIDLLEGPLEEADGEIGLGCGAFRAAGCCGKDPWPPPHLIQIMQQKIY
jgi:hypothetical protein